MLNDPISDYLTRIRNALGSGHDDVRIPASRLKEEMTRILKEQGYIVDFARKPAEVGEAIDIYVNNRLVARGEVVLVEEKLGVTMTEIIKAERA